MLSMYSQDPTVVNSSDLHPIANRDAEITIPPENRSLIDWASFTFKLYDPRDIAGIIRLNPSLFTELPSGFSGVNRRGIMTPL